MSKHNLTLILLNMEDIKTFNIHKYCMDTVKLVNNLLAINNQYS